MTPRAMNSRHAVESCTLQLHARKPFQLQTLSVEPPSSKPYSFHAKIPCRSDRSTAPMPTAAGDALHLTRQSIAIKCMSKLEVLRCGFSTNVCREIAAMRRLHHPHVIRLDEVLACCSKIYFVLEFAKGGELLSRGANRSRLPEDASRRPSLARSRLLPWRRAKSRSSRRGPRPPPPPSCP